MPLFHRHARGLILTEQGELLNRTVRDVAFKLDNAQARLADSRERPGGELRVTTTLGIGTNWLTPRLGEFLELYPEINLTLLLVDEELDLAMREADVAIRVREPVQADLVRRKIFTMHFHAYAAPAYLKKHGEPKSLNDLDRHRLLTYGQRADTYLSNINYLIFAGRDAKSPRSSTLTINNISALRRAVENGVGIAVLPDYLALTEAGLVRILPQADIPEMDCYLVYAEEMRNVARLRVFCDFLVANAQRWEF